MLWENDKSGTKSSEESLDVMITLVRIGEKWGEIKIKTNRLFGIYLKFIY